MGNCVDGQRAVSWLEEEDDDDRDWASSEESVNSQDDDNNKIDKNGWETSSAETTTATTEVKIKISKKQLEKLLKQVDGKDLTIQEVLADLMSSEDPGRHWKPALQSIPEVSE